MLLIDINLLQQLDKMYGQCMGKISLSQHTWITYLWIVSCMGRGAGVKVWGCIAPPTWSTKDRVYTKPWKSWFSPFYWHTNYFREEKSHHRSRRRGGEGKRSQALSPHPSPWTTDDDEWMCENNTYHCIYTYISLLRLPMLAEVSLAERWTQIDLCAIPNPLKHSLTTCPELPSQPRHLGVVSSQNTALTTMFQ